MDVVDLYRFSLARRSLLRVSLRGSGFRLQLLRDTGARLGGSESGLIERRVSKGRCFIAVRAIHTASGRYVLQRAAAWRPSRSRRRARDAGGRGRSTAARATRAVYRGTRDAAPSDTGYARVLVAAPV